MTERPDDAEQAAFYRTALFLGLVRGETVVRWADDVLAGSADAPEAFVEIASIPAGNLTALRLALLQVGDEHAPLRVIGAVLGLIGRHFESGQRSFGDTMTVLKQMRGSVRLTPDLVDDMRRFEIQLVRWTAMGDTTALESRVRQWFEPYEGAAISPF